MPTSPSTPRPARRLFLRRVAKDRRGVTAVEFALLAFPFVSLMMAILETSLLYFASTSLENGIVQASRDIRTGRFQADGGDASALRTRICQIATMVPNCEQDLAVDVRKYDNFGSATDDRNGPNPVAGGDLDTSGMGYQNSAAGEVVLARVYYEWQVMTPMIGKYMSNLNGNKHLLSAAVAFRNEPF